MKKISMENEDENTDKKLTISDVRCSISKVKLNEIFECDGKLYAIAKPDTASGDSNLQYGRSMFEFIRL